MSRHVRRYGLVILLGFCGTSWAEEPRALRPHVKVQGDIVRGEAAEVSTEIVIAFPKSEDQYFPLTDAGKARLAQPPVVQLPAGITVENFTIAVNEVPVRIESFDMKGYTLVCTLRLKAAADLLAGTRTFKIELPEVPTIAAEIQAKPASASLELDLEVFESKAALEQAIKERGAARKERENTIIGIAVTSLVLLNVAAIVGLFIRGRHFDRGTQRATLSMAQPLPPYCIYCCEPAAEVVPRTFYWTAAAHGRQGFLGLIALFTNLRSGSLNVPVCGGHRHRLSRERLGVWAAFLLPMLLGGLACIVCLVNDHEVVGVLMVIQGLLLGSYFGVFWATTSLHAEDIQHPLILLKPVSTQFVERCPPPTTAQDKFLIGSPP